MKLKKILLWGCVAILILLIAAVVAIGQMIEPAAQKALSEVVSPALGASVTAQKIDVSVLSGTCTVRGLSISNPGQSTGEALRFDTLSVSLDLWSLLGNPIHIKRIDIAGGDANCELNAGGSNLNALIPSPTGGSSATASTTGKATSSMPSASKLLDTVKKSDLKLPSSATNAPSGSQAATSGQAAQTSATASAGSSQSNIRVRIDAFEMNGCQIHAKTSLTGSQSLTLPLRAISLRDIGGTAEGVSPQEAISTIFSEVVRATVETATQQGAAQLRERATTTGEAMAKEKIKDAGSAVKGLFGR